MPKVGFHTDLKKAVPTRRTVLRTSAPATTALAAPFVRGAHAAGKLSFGVWDHWVHFRVLNTGQWNSQRLDPGNVG